MSHLFSSMAWHPFTYLLLEAIFGWILDWLKALSGFWDAFELGFWFETQGFSFWECLLSAPRALGSIQLHLRAPKASGWWLLIPICFHSRFVIFLLPSVRWMAPRQKTDTSRAQGKCPVEPSHPEQTEAAERRGMTRPSSVRLKTISATSKSSPRGKSSQWEVSISPNFSTSGLRDYLVRWDGCQLWWFLSWSSRIWCGLFILRRPMGLEDPYCPLWGELRSDWVPRVSIAFLTSLQLDSECIRLRHGPLCRDSSLERLFRGCADS